MNATSKVSSKSQTVLPRVIRERLGVRPGDTLLYRVTDDGVTVEKAPEADDDVDWSDPFECFTEWADEADEKAFAHLKP